MPIAQWNPNRMLWETDQIDLFSGLSEPYSETWQISGYMKPDGSLWPLPLSAPRIDVSESSLLPSPVAQQSGSTPEEHLRRKPGRTQVTDLAIIVENGLM
jgi:hypothetical protein